MSVRLSFALAVLLVPAASAQHLPTWIQDDDPSFVCAVTVGLLPAAKRGEPGRFAEPLPPKQVRAGVERLGSGLGRTVGYQLGPQGKRWAILDHSSFTVHDGGAKHRVDCAGAPHGLTWSADGSRVAYKLPPPEGSRGRNLGVVEVPRLAKEPLGPHWELVPRQPTSNYALGWADKRLVVMSWGFNRGPNVAVSLWDPATGERQELATRKGIWDGGYVVDGWGADARPQVLLGGSRGLESVVLEDGQLRLLSEAPCGWFVPDRTRSAFLTSYHRGQFGKQGEFFFGVNRLGLGAKPERLSGLGGGHAHDPWVSKRGTYYGWILGEEDESDPTSVWLVLASDPKKRVAIEHLPETGEALPILGARLNPEETRLAYTVANTLMIYDLYSGKRYQVAELASASGREVYLANPSWVGGRVFVTAYEAQRVRKRLR